MLFNDQTEKYKQLLTTIRKTYRKTLEKTHTKYIFVTGGNVSSIGKGIISSSVGLLMKSEGYSVTFLKFDPYINTDAGTMSPYQHGEVFVTDDGAETDLDLGHYERFSNISLTKLSNVTTGQIYSAVIERERYGDLLGKTIQVIPHITDEIKARILMLAVYSKPDVLIAEIGGTVGDIESLPFLEAIRQFRNDIGRSNAINIHVTLVPFLGPGRELKTKLTQHSVKELRSIGIHPDIIVTRTSAPLTPDMRDKISLFCDIDLECVIEGIDTKCVYEVPMRLDAEGLGAITTRKLGLKRRKADLGAWKRMIARDHSPRTALRVCVVGKYINLKDAYISITESMNHAAMAQHVALEFVNVDARIASPAKIHAAIASCDGLLIPYGFDAPGMEGKIEAIRYAREHKVPFFGLCVGLQCAVIEFARNVCGLKGANSLEFDPETPHPVISPMEEQKRIMAKGGTMRLGAWPCALVKGTLAHEAYGALNVVERHRHRFEINNDYKEILQEGGLVLSGFTPGGELAEIVEIPDHPFFLATQFHPEFKGRPVHPHPLFQKFVERMVEAKSHNHRRPRKEGVRVAKERAGKQRVGGRK